MATPPAITPRNAATHVFVDGELSQPQLSEADHHHLTRVLRLRPGATVTASDGQGGWVPCRLRSDGGLAPDGEVVREAVPAEPGATVAFALTKGERPDLVVQKLTELGVGRIVPFVAERSVVRWDDAKSTRRHDRFGELVRQAAMQSRRVTLPSVGLAPGKIADAHRGRPSPRATEPNVIPSFGKVVEALGERAVMADADGDAPGIAMTAVLIGPEGGWSPSERDTALPRIRLGEHILRAETAAITAGALIVALRSDIVSPTVPSRAEI